MADHAGRAGIAQKEHLGPGGLLASFAERRGGAVQVAGSPAAGDHR